MSYSHLEITHEKEPIRLFKSDFLEFFTHIHPVVILIIWVPVVVFFLVRGINSQATEVATRGGYVPLGFLAGLLLWTFAEYMLHRFVFHFKPRTPGQEKITYLFHGIHHAQPQCKTRLVMPPIVSIPLALLFYALFYVVLGAVLAAPHWIPSTFAGFITGYLIYDLTHYATHHIPMRRGIFKYLKQHHMKHHYKDPNRLFGVSSPLWDFVFGTGPTR